MWDGNGVPAGDRFGSSFSRGSDVPVFRRQHAGRRAADAQQTTSHQGEARDVPHHRTGRRLLRRAAIRLSGCSGGASGGKTLAPKTAKTPSTRAYPARSVSIYPLPFSFTALATKRVLCGKTSLPALGACWKPAP